MKRIKQIAQEAHLSEKSVIKYFKMSSYLTDKKRQVIEKTMKSLDITFEELRQKVVENEAQQVGKLTIGLLVRDLSEVGILETVEKIENKAKSYDYQVLLMQTKGDKELELNFLSLLQQNIISGVIMCTMDNHWDLIENYQEFGPIVCCSQHVPLTEHAQFVSGEDEGSPFFEQVVKIESDEVVYAMLTEKLADEKHVNGWDLEELEGFFGMESLPIVKTILEKRSDNLPKIVLTMGEEATEKISQELLIQGQRVPEDIAVIDMLDSKNEDYSIITLPTLSLTETALDSMDHLLKERQVQMYQLFNHMFVRHII
ncbi:hypothetical protein [Vagococcus sp.]|uniref:hypothetical protein n=1 Tax=Vagococcus sp. TaxID=1933889 RepID=UPI003F9C55E8